MEWDKVSEGSLPGAAGYKGWKLILFWGGLDLSAHLFPPDLGNRKGTVREGRLWENEV